MFSKKEFAIISILRCISMKNFMLTWVRMKKIKTSGPEWSEYQTGPTKGNRKTFNEIKHETRENIKGQQTQRAATKPYNKRTSVLERSHV